MSKDLLNSAEKEVAPEKERTDAGIVNEIHIRRLDDGSYHMRSTTTKGRSQEMSHPTPSSLMKEVMDQISSPHLPKLGSGARFAALKDKLGKEPGVYNPAGLAAAIGRKKLGAAKFDHLATAGRK